MIYGRAFIAQYEPVAFLADILMHGVEQKRTAISCWNSDRKQQLVVVAPPQ
jgi:hypothetical protein